MRSCKTCGTTKPIGLFQVRYNKGNPYILWDCIECYAQKNRARSRRWAKQNPEKRRIQALERYYQNHDRLKEANKKTQQHYSEQRRLEKTLKGPTSPTVQDLIDKAFQSVDIPTKRCVACKETKPLTDFYADRSTKDGIKASCKFCEKTRIPIPRVKLIGYDELIDKQCNHCDQTLPIGDFGYYFRNNIKLCRGVCKACTRKRSKTLINQWHNTPNIPTHKQCAQCLKSKPLDAFNPHVGLWGRAARCRQCERPSPTHKQCSTCKEIKPIGFFDLGPKGMRPIATCRVCVDECLKPKPELQRPESKICPKCKADKLLIQFYASAKSKWGVRSWCKVCEDLAHTNYVHANYSKVSKQKAIYSHKRYQEPEYLELRCQKSQAWYRAHTDKARVTRARWVRNNPEKFRTIQQRRRAALKAVPNTLTEIEWLAIVEQYKHCCAYCLQNIAKRITLDHVIPVSKGGPNSKDNVVPACKSCNCTKGDRTVEYLIRRLIARGVIRDDRT